MFRTQLLSNYGTATPAVARTVVQGDQLLQAFGIKGPARDAILESLSDLQRQLIRCGEDAGKVSSQIEKALLEVEKTGLNYGAGGRSVSLPSVPDLRTKVESFLQAAKLGIREVGALFDHFFGTDTGHRFDKKRHWMKKNGKSCTPLGEWIVESEPWLRSIIDLRNVVDHPKSGPAGKLVVNDFALEEVEGEARLLVPMWGVTDGKLTQLGNDLTMICEGILNYSEHMLCLCLLDGRASKFLTIVEIPEEQRSKSCPIRFRADVDFNNLGA